MKLSFSPGLIASLAALALGAGGLSGCREAASSSGQEGARPHIGHERPAHWPESLEAAVGQLRRLGQAIDSQPGDAPAAEANLRMALDIAGWLPEIAADSDMPEPSWNEVNTLAAGLVREIEKRSARRTAEAPRLGPVLAEPLLRLQVLSGTTEKGHSPTDGS